MGKEGGSAEVSSKSLLCSAINSHHLVRFWYEDSMPGFRIVEPHELALNKLNHVVLKAWFLAGESASQQGEGEGWREYLLENVSSLSVLEAQFQPWRLGL
jgi:hypothetical protein